MQSFSFPGGADLSSKTNLLKVIQEVIVIFERNQSILIFCLSSGQGHLANYGYSTDQAVGHPMPLWVVP